MKKVLLYLITVITLISLVSCGNVSDSFLEKGVVIRNDGTVFGGECQIFNGKTVYVNGDGKLYPRTLKQKTGTKNETLISDLSLPNNDVLSSVVCNEKDIYVISDSTETERSYIYKLNGKELQELAHIDKIISESVIYEDSIFLKEVYGNLYMLNLSDNEVISVHGGIDDFCINNGSLYYLYKFKGYELFKYDLANQNETKIEEVDLGGELLTIEGDYIIYINDNKLCLYNYIDNSTLIAPIENGVSVVGANIIDSSLYVNTLKDDSLDSELIEYSISESAITDEHRFNIDRIQNVFYTTENGVIYVNTVNGVIYEINNGVAKKVFEY